MFAKIIALLFRPIVACLVKDKGFLELLAVQCAGVLDNDAIAAHIAESKSAAEIARYIDTDDLVQHLSDDIDLDRVKEYVANGISASDVAEAMDTDDIRDCIKDNLDITASTVAGEIELSDLARELDYDIIAEKISVSASKIAEHIDHSDIAGELDLSDIASEISVSDLASEIDLSSLADNIDTDAIVEALVNSEECLDYTKLAKALLKQFAKATAVEVRPATK